MNNRQRAVGILTEMRETLANRLTERVLDNAEELLEDAHGESYRGEIEQLFEQLGNKLCLVNQVLSNLPSIDDASDFGELPEMGSETMAESTDARDSGVPRMTNSEANGGLATTELTTVATGRTAMTTNADQLRLFLWEVLHDDFDAAAHVLELLFGLEETQALDSTLRFARQAKLNDADVAVICARLDQAGVVELDDASLAILWNRFGLTANESRLVWSRMQHRAELMQ